MGNKPVALVIAHHGYQPVEYSVPQNILENSGIQVVTISDKPGVATATDETTTEVDTTLDIAQASDYAGIFFIGGSGALEHLDNELSYKLIQEAVEHKIPLGAICISTRILAKAGILHGKQATGWDEDNELATLFQEHEVLYKRQPVVIDDGIVTAVGPKNAQEFAEKILSILP